MWEEVASVKVSSEKMRKVDWIRQLPERGDCAIFLSCPAQVAALTPLTIGGQWKWRQFFPLTSQLVDIKNQKEWFKLG